MFHALTSNHQSQSEYIRQTEYSINIVLYLDLHVIRKDKASAKTSYGSRMILMLSLIVITEEVFFTMSAAGGQFISTVERGQFWFA